MDIGDRIKICLKQQNMNMKDLATKAEIPLSTLSDLMNGKTQKLDIKKAKDISSILHCTLDYLIDADLLSDEIGDELKEERERQGYSLGELSESTGIPVNILQAIEESEEQINFFLLKKICDVYGITISEFYVNSELYDLYIPSEFNGDVNSFEAFQKAVAEDAMNESIPSNASLVSGFIKVPVIGRIPAGSPVIAVQNIDSYEDIPCSWLNGDPTNYFILKIEGDSMEGDKVFDGDYALIMKCSSCDNGQICAVGITGETPDLYATLKRVYELDEEYLELVPENSKYPRRKVKRSEVNIFGVLKFSYRKH